MQCDTCGNEYHAGFTATTTDGQSYAFDSIECAAQLLAPLCRNCGCRILGHGIDGPQGVFCCANCARAEGVPARDQAQAG